MSISPKPKTITTPFAQGATLGSEIHNIPVPSQAGVDPQLASYSDGFPPATMIPKTSGGLPPYGQDMNGILNDISSHVRYLNAGGTYHFNQTISDSIGGYNKGAVLISNDDASAYISTIENNTINFNTSPSSIGVQWKPYGGQAVFNAIPSEFSPGTTTVFHQKFAPTGWAKITNPAYANATMIITAGSLGGTIGGNTSHNLPAGNNFVPAHHHAASLTGNTDGQGIHAHNVQDAYYPISTDAWSHHGSPGNAVSNTTGDLIGSGSEDTDNDLFLYRNVVSDAQGFHGHSVSVTGNTAANSGAVIWQPLWAAFILCQKL